MHRGGPRVQAWGARGEAWPAGHLPCSRGAPGPAGCPCKRSQGHGHEPTEPRSCPARLWLRHAGKAVRAALPCVPLLSSSPAREPVEGRGCSVVPWPPTLSRSSSGWGVGRLLPCPSPPSRHPPPASWESWPAPAPPHPTCSRPFGRLACGPERPLLPAPSVSRLPLVLLELGPGPAPSLASLLPPGRTHRCLLGAAGRRSRWLVASVSSTKFHEPRPPGFSALTCSLRRSPRLEAGEG